MPATSALNPSIVRTLLTKKKVWNPNSLKKEKTMALSSVMKAKMGIRKNGSIKQTMSLPKKAAKQGPANAQLKHR